MNTKNDDLLKAAVNASNTIVSFYEWIDRINAAGGAASISGVAECHAFLKSMEKNRAGLDKLIMEPLQAQIAARKGGAE